MFSRLHFCFLCLQFPLLILGDWRNYKFSSLYQLFLAFYLLTSLSTLFAFEVALIVDYEVL